MSLTITSGLSGTQAETWSNLHNAINAHDLPGCFPSTPEMVARFERYPWPARSSEFYIGWLAGEPVAIMELSLPMRDNLKNMSIDLKVHPSHRRGGIGRKFYDLAVERAKANDRTKLQTHTGFELPGLDLPVPAGPPFVQGLGFESANLTEVMRRFDLSTADEAALDDLLAKAVQASDGYRVLTWADETPAELVEDVAYLDGRLMTDAPMGDLDFEPAMVDADRIREADQVNKDRGRRLCHAGAVHTETGKLVAWTTISHDPEVDWHAWQQITIVDPEHRGHRLGALVKVENLRYFRQAEPGVKIIDTFNAATNNYMISINEDMGFRVKCAFANWQRDI
jgi:GNAT superfamily N-acetyltransferase